MFLIAAFREEHIRICANGKSGIQFKRIIFFMYTQQMSIHEALQKAIGAQKDGNLQDAEQLYRSILQVQPNHPDANHNLGVIAIQVNKSESSLPFFKAALEVDPQCSQFWISYIGALTEVGRIENAALLIDRAKSKNINTELISKLELIIDSYNTKYNKIKYDGSANRGKKQDTSAVVVSKTITMNHIVELFSCGNYLEAERTSKNFIRQYPDDSFGYLIIGSILAKHNKSTKAVSILKKGLKLSNNDPYIYNSLGKSLNDLGRLDEAIECYENALELKPDFAEVYNNIGIVFQKQGKPDEAIIAYKKSLKMKPKFANAYNNMGIIYQEQGVLDKALLCYMKAYELAPKHVEAYYNAGVVLNTLGNHGDAAICYKKVLEIDPSYYKAYNNLGITFQNLGEFNNAITYYKKALGIKSDYAEAYNNMGNVFKELDKIDEAIVCYKQALRKKPNYAEACNNIGVALQYLGKHDDAIMYYKNSLMIDEYFAEAYNNIGNALNELGDIDEAISYYEKSLKIKSDYAEAYYNALDISRYHPDAGMLRRLNEVIDLPKYTNFEKLHAHFALGKYYNKIADYKNAFENFKLGHDYRYKINKIKNCLYDDSDRLKNYDFFTKIFSYDFFTKRHKWGSEDDTPIFIVGFPRSGTSLVEQILSSHSLVFGAGELKDISNLISKFIDFESISDYSDFCNSFNRDKVTTFSKIYLDKIKTISNNRRFVIDKMPHNFEHLWYIGLLFPKSTILHCVRGPEDTCLSCYFNKFACGHEYIDDLTSLARHYKYYKKMMELWKSVLPVKIYDISYEQLVNAPSIEISKLLSFCNLDFEDKCLEFYKTHRAVRTASASQVREKIYTSSIGKWKRYEKFLGPFLEELHRS